jgi:hypothetical protein
LSIIQLLAEQMGFRLFFSMPRAVVKTFFAFCESDSMLEIYPHFFVD